MALKYGDSMPSAIKYNGQDVKIVKYGTQAVWGKYYTLNMSVPQNIDVTVTRVSSPNQHGYTALLTNSSTIYYGDVINITAVPKPGFELKTFTVNGQNFISGNNITVEGDISIVVTEIGWHLEWYGSQECDITTLLTNISGSMQGEYSDPYISVSNANVSTLLSSSSSTNISISGHMTYTIERTGGITGSSTGTEGFNDVLLNGTISATGCSVKLKGWGTIVGFTTTDSGILCELTTSSNSYGGMVSYTETIRPTSITITQIKRYY